MAHAWVKRAERLGYDEKDGEEFAGHWWILLGQGRVPSVTNAYEFVHSFYERHGWVFFEVLHSSNSRSWRGRASSRFWQVIDLATNHEEWTLGFIGVARVCSSTISKKTYVRHFFNKCFYRDSSKILESSFMVFSLSSNIPVQFWFKINLWFLFLVDFSK